MKPITYKNLTKKTEEMILQFRNTALANAEKPHGFDSFLTLRSQANAVHCFWIKLTSAEGINSQQADSERLSELTNWNWPMTDEVEK